MIISDDRKRAAMLIVGRLHKDGSLPLGHDEKAEVEGDEKKMALREAMSDLLDAIEHKSPGDMADAFEAAFICCEQMEPEPEPVEE
jgi:hypothetical protein